jgi:hypothetical protein
VAAIKIAEFNRRMDALIAKLPDKALDALEGIGADTKKRIQQRITEQGTDYNGQAFAPYTEAYLRFKQDVGLYRGFVDLNLGNYSINKRIAAIESRKRSKRTSRRKAGLESNIKTLSREDVKSKQQSRRAKAIPEASRLWRNIQIIEKKKTGNILFVTVGAVDDLNKKKLQGLAKKRGDIMGVSKSELDNINKTFKDGVSLIISEAFR